jgi:membrane associated rhomboid family serine protease
MGIESRDYYRQSNAYDGSWGDWGLYHLTPVVKYLIIINVAIFVLELFITRPVPVSPLEVFRNSDPELNRLLAEKGDDPNALEEILQANPQYAAAVRDALRHPEWYPDQRVSILQEWFELDTKKVLRGQVWRLLTYAFCHERYGLFHIFFNMLFLYWWGCSLESMYGAREFLLFYLTAAVVAGLTFVGLDLSAGSAYPEVGASGAVLAVAMLYAMHFPREIFCIFWVLRVEMRWLLLGYVVWNLYPVVLTMGGDRGYAGFGHAAHLGGLLFGFLYAKFQLRLDSFGERIPGLRWQRTSRPQNRVTDADMDRVDQILEKISKCGESSLTDEERTFLRDASSRMKSRRGR